MKSKILPTGEVVCLSGGVMEAKMVSATVVPTPNVSFNNGPLKVLEFRADGTVWANPDLKPDDAAKAVIKAITDLWGDCRDGRKV